MTIIGVPTPSLRLRSQNVSKEELADAQLQSFMDQLIPTMYGDEGIGIAAPQVARNLQICVIGKEAIPKDHELAGDDLILINPTFTKTSKRLVRIAEGCLSVPGAFGPVKRHKDILVTAMLRTGEEISFEAHNFFARVIQHEIDHLNGILFIDRAEELEETDHVRKVDFDIILANIKPV